MPNQTTSDKHYDCKTCVNRGSPLCELCTHIASPSGKERKPTYYIAQSSILRAGGRSRFQEHPTENNEIESLAKFITSFLCQRVPIPISVVMEYNRKTEKGD